MSLATVIRFGLQSACFMAIAVATMVVLSLTMSFGPREAAPVAEALPPAMTVAAVEPVTPAVLVLPEPVLILRETLDGPEVFAPEPVAALPVVSESVANATDSLTGEGGPVSRWNPLIAEASERFGVPKSWIRAVIRRESGGYTIGNSGRPITSRAGAMGLMQIMPATYEELRVKYGLGHDPHDPRNNILAGTAYLGWLRQRYGYPELFAAYNHGPGNFERRQQDKRALPRETRNYVAAITASLRGKKEHGPRRPDVSMAEILGLRLATL